MNWGRIQALIVKDFSLFFRNGFIAVMTVMGILFYILIYFLMPESVDETLEIGVYSPVDIPGFTQVETEGLVLVSVESSDVLNEGVIAGDFTAGIVLPSDFMQALVSGDTPEIDLYVASDVPQEIKDSVTAITRELVYQLSGQPLTVGINEEVIGDDMIGMQVPPRDRMRPLLAIFIIMFETFGLANLIAEERERGTVRALLVTPMSIKELFVAKGLFGIGLAFFQAVVFMGIVGGLNQHPVIIILALLLASFMATAVGFLIGSLAKDFMSVLAWGMICFIILAIPGFGVLFPGAVTGWIKFIPSYYLVDMVHTVTGFGAGWGDIWGNILILLAFNAAVFWIGILGIRRKIQ
ncbi:MAG: ABC transporter permease [Dehalococcoidales bacterium]|nr:MAG: ABC transporter permease [Dehalococcoidales bacterium]